MAKNGERDNGVHRWRGGHHRLADPRAPGAQRGRGAGALHRAGAPQGSGRQARADGRGGRARALPARRGGGESAAMAAALGERAAPRCWTRAARTASIPIGPMASPELSAEQPARIASAPRVSPCRAATRPAPIRSCARWSRPGSCRGPSGHGQCRLRLHRRRQGDDRRVRPGARSAPCLRAVRPRLRAQARAGAAALWRAGAAADLHSRRGALRAGHAVLRAAAPRRAAGPVEPRDLEAGCASADARLEWVQRLARPIRATGWSRRR